MSVLTRNILLDSVILLECYTLYFDLTMSNVNLLGQSCLEQSRVCEFRPEHGRPPLRGEGLSHFLVLIFVPSPQVTSHVE